MSKNFRGYGDDGLLVPVTTASAITALHSNPVVAAQAADALVDNRGTADACIRFGGAEETATDLCVRVPAGAMLAFAKGNATHIAAKTAAGTTNLVVHIGEGQ